MNNTYNFLSNEEINFFKTFSMIGITNILIQKIETNIEKFNFLFELIIVNLFFQIKKVFNQKNICILKYLISINSSQRAIALRCYILKI